MSKDLQLAKRFIALPLEKRRQLWTRFHDEGIDPRLLPIPAGVDSTDAGLASYAQARLYFLWRLAPDSTAYNIFTAIRMRGALDIDALQTAMDRMVARHPALRSNFSERDDGNIEAIIHASRTVPIQVLPPEYDSSALGALLERHAATVFHLERDALLRLHLIRTGDNEHMLSMVLHHIIADDRSMTVLLQELMQFYSSAIVKADAEEPALAPSSIEYADYALWQRSLLEAGERDRQLAYWREKLGGDIDLLALPTDRPRPIRQSFRGAQHAIELPAALTAQLKALARQGSATTFTLLLAAFNVLLHRYTGQRRLRVGIPVANRQRVETERLIGFFVNTQVLQVEVDSSSSFLSLLSAVRQTTLEAQEHQDIPFEQLVEALQPQRSMAHTPLFQVMFSHLQAGKNLRSQYRMEGLQLEAVNSPVQVAKFDLDLATVENESGTLTMVFTYATDLFEASTIARMAAQWERLLASIVAQPERRLSDLPMLTETERVDLLSRWNASRFSYPQQHCLHELIEQQAAQQPDAVAVVMGTESLSYDQLNRQANRLARHLRTLGVGPEQLVGIALERSTAMIVSVLAVLKAGGAYVPLDPAYPAQRLAYMLDDARPQVLITQSGIALPAGDAALVLIDQQTLDEGDDSNLPLWTTPENQAYCIYTSGSTGQPKGVMVQHGSVVNFLFTMAEAPGLTATDRMLGLTSLSFDIAALEIYLPLIKGARLILASREQGLDPGQLLACIRTHDISVIQATPSTWRMLSEHEQAPVLKGRKLLCGGEALPPDLAHTLIAHAGQVWNVYGPTETTIWSARHCLDRDHQHPLIGGPIGNTQLHVLDADLNLTPVGVVGELYIGGDGLARGYRGQAALTAQRFIADPFCSEGGKRLYRTGDLVRRHVDGSIEYVGRIDHQIKLRGFRIELGEIEARLATHARIREAVVALKDGAGGKQLVAYVVANGVVERDELKAYLAAQLPEYMVPSQLVLLEAMPLTANGKIDRSKLPEPEVIQAEYVAPQTELEIKLAHIWQEVLGLPRVGMTDNFFELGGHSLLATQVVSRIQRRLGLEVPLRSIFEAPVLDAFTAAVAAAGTARDDLILPLGLSSAPLSLAQSRLWFLWQLDPQSSAYNIPSATEFVGELDLVALQRTFDRLVARHAVLRSNFSEDGSEVSQQIAAKWTTSIEQIDLRMLPPDERADRIADNINHHGRRPFDLRHDHLLRVTLLMLEAQRHVLLVSMHHVIADGWSMQVLVDDFVRLYNEETRGIAADLPALPIQYADYAVWQRNWLAAGEGARQLAYWQSALGDIQPVLELPTDRIRPNQPSHRGARLQRRLPATLAQQIKALAASRDASSFMVLLASFQLLLHRYSGQSDIRVGVPVANRRRLETEHLIGCFINTQVLRAQFDGVADFNALLAQVRETALGAQAHQDLPFEQLVEALQPERSLSHHPLFQVMFNHQRSNGQALRCVEGLQIKALERDAQVAKFDLDLALLEDDAGHMDVIFTYATDLFEASTIARMAAQWERLLTSIVAQPERRLGDLPMLAETERVDLLSRWNASRFSYPQRHCLHELIEQQAAQQPDAVAVVMGTESLSYDQLNRQANRLARHLRTLGVGPEQLVGIALERSAAMIVSVLAVLKAGGAYVPLDPAYPAQRLAYMLADARPQVLITQSGIALPAGDAAVVLIDQQTLEEGDDSNLPTLTTPENQAYCIYTSGSTGQPKGVMVQHGSVVNFLFTMAEAPGLTATDHMLGLTSLSFDIAALEIYLPLIKGARLILASREQGLDPGQLLACIRTHDISVIQATPSTWRMLSEHEQAPVLKGRKLLCGGEALPPDLAHTLIAHAGQVWNVYGPTETTIWSARHCLDRDHPHPLIGGPIGNTQLHVLDADLNLTPVGVVGELYIGGDGLARGYRGQAALTAQRFIADPFCSDSNGGKRLYRTGDLVRRHVDGSIEYVGRIDHQIKLRGFRIELGEIEARLATHARIREAVVALKDGAGGKQLVAYVVANGVVERDELKAYLAAELPEYMVPSQLVLLEAMPLTANGKIDRSKLPEPEVIQAEYVAPQTELEIKLAHIWQEVLGLPRVGMTDNFFRSGGHSLLAVRASAQIRNDFLVDVSLRSFFEAPTLRALAATIEQSLTRNDAAGTVSSLNDLLDQLELPEVENG